MDYPLFRQSALDHQSERLYGEVVLSQSLSLSVLTYGLLLLVIIAALFLALGSYARRETVAGYLVPDKGLVKVYAPMAGILDQVHVADGAQVASADLLFSVTTSHLDGAGSDRDVLLLNELTAQKADLEHKITQEQNLRQVQSLALAEQITGVERELQALEQAIVIERQQLVGVQANMSHMEQLFQQGHVADREYQQQKQALLGQQEQLQTVLRQQIQLSNQLTGLRHQQQESPLRWQSQLADLKRALSDLEQRMLEISGRRTYAIRAPVGGRLTALQVKQGQTLDPRSLLVAILPENSRLQAELFLPTRAAGFVKQGQQVYLRYAAFPYQHYGLYQGVVANVAQVILAPNELPIPLSLNEPVYRVKVDLDSQRVQAYGKEFPLQAGMLLDADIVLEQRSLVEWLLEPVLGLRGRL